MKRRLLMLAVILALLPGCQNSGDRVLVAKWLYDSNLTPPNRYDVVVFKYPAMPIENGTPKNYIKRLLGLPGELLALFFGRLYLFNPPAEGVPEGVTAQEWRELLDTSHANALDLWKGPDPLRRDGLTPKNYVHPTAQKLWENGSFNIVRKPPSVMLALSRPVFDNDHQAKDLAGILPDRWAAPAGSAWVPDDPHGFKVSDASQDEQWLRYRHILRPADWPNSKNDAVTINQIKARKHMPQLITDFLGYNTYEAGIHSTPLQNWVGDLMLACKLTVEEPKGEFRMELSKGVNRFQACFDLATGQCTLWRSSIHIAVVDGKLSKVIHWEPLGTADTRVKAPGEYSIRFANYDERLTVWVGRDLPFEDGIEYPAPDKYGPDTAPVDPDAGLDAIKNNDLQPASLCAVGASVKVHAIQLLRDTYYTGFDPHSSNPIMTCDHSPEIRGEDWSHPSAWEPLRHLTGKTIYVYPGHYFCLGDNSPESSDSRAWGLVPERLMLGRALMVYFPFDRAGMIK